MTESDFPILGTLSPIAQQHADAPRHHGTLEGFNRRALITGPCGDTMEFWLHVADGRVARIGFTTTGCGTSLAAGSMTADLAFDKTVMDAKQLTQQDVLAALHGLPTESEHCALLAVNTLKAALSGDPPRGY